ncbi:ADP-heptose--LPS heptosyltransferase 2 [Adhaeretor mobilis]|uniref:lipopolysaccharide heptosyltransferase II n=2 Tax=Adhaeretor mobilis TaxID=1930276 RepID=A0A517MZX1_9BACT|nr:ADP-heptose--LPS heptosyltransferase 2 [Adhaeretor mobilis]
MRVGVFLPNWIGDVVMATPAIRALRKQNANGELVGIMRPYVGEVLAGNSWFDETILYKKKAEQTELQWPQVKQKLRDAKLDRVVLLTNSLRTAWMAWQSGAPERIGTVRDVRGPLLTTRVYQAKKRKGWGRAEDVQLPAIDGYLQVTTAAGCPPEPPELELATTPADEQAADEAWRVLKLPDPSQVVVFNTGGAFGAAKDWPRKHFISLARAIAERDNLHVLINCGPSERDNAREIVSEANDSRITSLADIADLPIGLSKACIRRSRLLVSTDSGPRFFGVAFGVPTVTLFGPTSTHWTRTYADHEKRVSLELDCAPCMKRVCPLGHHRCMEDLAVERVHTEVARYLSKPMKSNAAA